MDPRVEARNTLSDSQVTKVGIGSDSPTQPLGVLLGPPVVKYLTPELAGGGSLFGGAAETRGENGNGQNPFFKTVHADGGFGFAAPE